MKPISPTDAQTCRVIRPATSHATKQGLTYGDGLTSESVGARQLSMQVVRIPPGARAKAHLHEGHETTIFVLKGAAKMWFGPRLEDCVEFSTGDWLFIPAGVPHLPFNPHGEECVGIVARTDPNEQESVVLLPELDALHP